jgi:hypothetical protein
MCACVCMQAFPDELTEVTEEDIRMAERRSKDRALAVRAAMANRFVLACAQKSSKSVTLEFTMKKSSHRRARNSFSQCDCGHPSCKHRCDKCSFIHCMRVNRCISYLKSRRFTAHSFFSMT